MIETSTNSTKQITAIGLAIYTYAQLEERVDPLNQWIKRVEDYLGLEFSEFHFNPFSNGKRPSSRRVWKASEQNRSTLLQRLYNEQPWYVLDFGYPRGVLKNSVAQSNGAMLFIKSRTLSGPGDKRFREPSFASIIIHPEIFAKTATGIEGLLDLGIQAWEMVDGVYGFIDVEAPIPLHDHMVRNISHINGSLVPPSHAQEFWHWQNIRSTLHNRIWKPFWANFLGAPHLHALGGLNAMRAADPLYRVLPEYLDAAYNAGLNKIRENSPTLQIRDLPHEGKLVLLPGSPMNWFEPQLLAPRTQMQSALNSISIPDLICP